MMEALFLACPAEVDDSQRPAARAAATGTGHRYAGSAAWRRAARSIAGTSRSDSSVSVKKCKRRLPAFRPARAKVRASKSARRRFLTGEGGSYRKTRCHCGCRSSGICWMVRSSPSRSACPIVGRKTTLSALPGLAEQIGLFGELPHADAIGQPPLPGEGRPDGLSHQLLRPVLARIPLTSRSPRGPTAGSRRRTGRAGRRETRSGRSAGNRRLAARIG